ncbi:IS3 family transposase [uncultured Sphaerochaeta sp.]|nr:IS3 family transposase [Bacilli bacterium]
MKTFGRLKNEIFYTCSLFGISIEELCSLLEDYIYLYNRKRIQISFPS